MKYIQNQIAQSNARALSYILDENGEKNPKRNLYPKINKQVSKTLDRVKAKYGLKQRRKLC